MCPLLLVVGSWRTHLCTLVNIQLLVLAQSMCYYSAMSPRRKPNGTTRSRKLTERERQFLYYLRDFQYEQRYSPAMERFSMLFGYTHQRALQLAHSVVKKGFAEWSADVPPHKRLLFPKGMTFPWKDIEQFPSTIFLPR